MSVFLWILQSLLAIIFLMAGGMKLLMPLEQLVSNGMAFVEDTPWWLVRFIGLAEIAGALGLILPAATKIKPRLTPLASASLTVVMFLAVCTHLVRAEYMMLGAPILLGLLAAFVAWGRWSHSPINAGDDKAQREDRGAIMAGSS